MEIKHTELLRDDPSEHDALGSHTKIAKLIGDEILNSSEGRSIALVGEWGSGKSTVIRLLEKILSDKSSPQSGNACIFIYDAWSHQGDLLRRAFLEDLICFFKEKSLLTSEESEKFIDKIWNREEKTTITTEPVLRPHTLLCLALFIVSASGVNLFHFPETLDNGLLDTFLTTKNLFACIVIAVFPLLLSVLLLINKFASLNIREKFFGKNIGNNYSVLSFLFQKVHGHKEHKTIRSPADSIIVFKSIFNDILNCIEQKNKDLKVIIVTDNIDRIPSGQAREFWSTMQTFFNEDGGMRKNHMRKYWLVAPFSTKALSFVFCDEKNTQNNVKNIESARAYISKTFSISFDVPLPILTNWRKYFEQQLKIAFPEHEERELHAVLNLYDLQNSQTKITPRDIKLFINNVVAMYKQHGSEIGIVIIAAYNLHRSDYTEKDILNLAIPPAQLSIISQKNWRASFAALHFGVPVDQANQILLQEPIVEAIRDNNEEELRDYEKHHGFSDILQGAIRQLLSTNYKPDGVGVTEIAAMLDSLDVGSLSAYNGMWEELADKLIDAKSWENFQTSPVAGISAILKHNNPQKQITICNEVSRAFSSVEMGDPKQVAGQVSINAQNWLNAAVTLVENSTEDNPVEIKIPGNNAFQLQVLQQLALAECDVETKSMIKYPANAEALSATLVASVSAGLYLKSPATLVNFIGDNLKLQLKWPNILDASVGRLQQLDINPQEAAASIEFIVSIGIKINNTKAFEQLKELSVAGFISHLYAKYHQIPKTRAAILSSVFLSNPKLDRPQHVEQSPNGDNLINSLLNAKAFDAGLIADIALFTRSLLFGGRLAIVGMKNEQLSNIIAAVQHELIKSNYSYSIDAKTLLEGHVFLANHSSDLPTSGFLTAQTKFKEFLDLMSSQAFEVKYSRLYLDAIQAALGKNELGFIEFIKNSLVSLPQNIWLEYLNSDTSSLLIEIYEKIKSISADFYLSTKTRDAALDQIRKISQGQITVIPDGQAKLDRLIECLATDLQKSLVSDVLDDAMGANATAASITKIVQIFGKHIPMDALPEPDKIIRRLFKVLIEDPNDQGLDWILLVINSRPDINKKLISIAKGEFSLRIRAAMAMQTVPEPTLKKLVDIANALRIEISALQQKEIENKDDHTKVV